MRVAAVVLVAVVTVICACTITLIPWTGDDGGDRVEQLPPGPTGIVAEGLPEGYVTVGQDRILAPHEVTWHVRDLLHSHYSTDSSGAFTDPYIGYEVESDVLELGVGGNTPGIIKYPFWQMTYGNPKAVYACVNYGEAWAPREIWDRSICIDGDIGEELERIRLLDT